MEENREALLDRLQILSKRNEVAKKQRAKYENMTFTQVLQCPENKKRLERVEKTQKWTMETIIKKKYKWLEKEKGDLFAEYFMGFLKGKWGSMAEFWYKDRLDPNHELKDEFKEEKQNERITK